MTRGEGRQSLCTGYGGLELAAADLFDATTAWTADPARGPAAVIAHRFPGVPNVGDLWDVDWTGVEPVDVITAGYPCQPFSMAGNRKGTDDHRHLWPAVVACLRALRPRVVLLENVTGHLSLGLGDVLGDLAALGYDTRWGCVRAADAGAPHKRDRLFIASADAERVGWEWARDARRRLTGPADHGGAAADAHSDGRARLEGAQAGRDALHGHVRGDADGRGDGVSWGAYGPAIARWEAITGRPAPRPAEPTGRAGKLRLAPRFVEWMQGLPDGWVTAVPGLSRRDQLKLLGNGVVPAQARLAFDLLIGAAA